MVVEQYMYDAYRRNEERVNQLHRALDAGMATEAFVRIIFDWPAPIRGKEEKPEPVTIPTKTVAPPPPKPMTSKKAEMMAKVKKLHLELLLKIGVLFLRELFWSIKSIAIGSYCSNHVL